MIKMFNVNMNTEGESEVLKTLYGGMITQGPKVDEFETALAKWVGTPNVVTVNSGTSALTLALRLAGATQGTEVISTPMTCSATNEPILALGADIVWADSDPLTGLISWIDIMHKITDKTVAVMCVDWGGTPCDYDMIRHALQVAGRPDIKIIADAAHAFGSTYKDKLVGSVADMTCFSFQAIKHLTTVDGGALTVLDDELYHKAKTLRWFGIDRTIHTDFRGGIDIPEYGYKFHMNDVNATIGLENLKEIGDVILNHCTIGNHYDWEFEDHQIPALSTRPNYNYFSSRWLYTILLNSMQEREDFKAFMKAADIEVSQVHARNDTFTCFKEYQTFLPGLDYFTERMICIPIHAGMKIENAYLVLDAIREFYA